jgi:hypothetical protein
MRPTFFKESDLFAINPCLQFKAMRPPVKVSTVEEGMVYCLIIVTLAACEGPAPPPEAVAMFVRVAKFKSAWVMV